MNTAHIDVLTIALSTGGIAAYLASGPHKIPPAEPVAQLQTVVPEQSETLARARQSGTPSLVLRRIVDPNPVETRSDDQASRRSGSSNVVRHGVSSPTATQKRPKGSTR